MTRDESRRAEILAHIKEHGPVPYEHMAEALPGDFRGIVHLMASQGELDRTEVDGVPHFGLGKAV